MTREARLFVSFLFILLMTTVMSGCTHQNTSLASVYDSWTLLQIKRADSVLSLHGSKHRFTLTLAADGGASGEIACNRWQGRNLLVERKLQIQSPGSTRKRCIIDDNAIASLERTYLKLLQQPSLFHVNEQQLQLDMSNGELWIFERQTN